MMKKLCFATVIFSVLLNFSACKISNDEDTVVNVEPIFSVDMIEDLTGEKGLNFIINSVELQDCNNYSIGHEKLISTNMLEIVLNDITAPEDCISEIAPAESTIPMGFLGNNRSYNVSIHLKDIVENKGTLVINYESYTLELETSHGLGIIRSELLKVPQNIIWGYVSYNNESIVQEMPFDFQNEINELGQQVSLKDGYYGYYSISEMGDVQIEDKPNHLYINSFLLNYEGDIEQLESLLETYRNDADGIDIDFRIFTSTGEDL